MLAWRRSGWVSTTWCTSNFKVFCFAATGTNATQYTSAEIEEFQILLWTSLVLVAILAAVLCLMLNMDAHRDPVLYSQYKGTSRDVKRD